MTLPKLLLHVCCGVCSAYVPERLIPEFDVTVYFENSNLYPREEFFKRMEAAKTMAATFNIPFLVADYEPTSWYKNIRGLAKEPERGLRCKKCISYRLDKTMMYAKTHHFKWVATTLSVSRRKNAAEINELGHALANNYHLNFLGKDWKKENGEKISQEKAKATGIYRQNYCGCVYSLANKNQK